jgi:urease accessory protein
MNASASIVCSVANGLPRIEEMVSQPPLTFRETTDGVMIVNTAAGPLGGDRLHLRATVKDGAELKLGGVAASMALPGAPGTGFSQSNILITLGDAAKLIWLPQPIIMADGSHHRQMITINAQPSSQFIYGDAFQFGRHKEETGRIEQHVAVNIDGVPVLRQSTDINPEDDWKEAFSLQEARTFGSHITFGIEISNSAEFTKFELENGIHIYQSIGTLLAPKLSVKVAM